MITKGPPCVHFNELSSVASTTDLHLFTHIAELFLFKLSLFHPYIYLYWTVLYFIFLQLISGFPHDVYSRNAVGGYTHPKMLH